MKFSLLVGILLATFLFAAAVPGHASPTSTDPTPLALDGSAIGGCSNLFSSCSATLTTSQPNDIVIAYAGEALDAQFGSSCVFSISDTAGMSWAPRSGVVFQRFGRDQLQEFWARSASVLSSDVVTESILGCGTNYNGVQVFAISGANFNSPFDPNLTLPGTSNGDVSVTTVSVTISTNIPNDFVFAGVDNDNGALPMPQSGFTNITSIGGFGSEYEIPTGSVTNFAVTFGFSSSSYWEIIADAVQPAGAAVPPPLGTQTLSVSISVAPLYFPGETAVIYIQSGLNGHATGVSALSVILILPSGTNQTLKTVQVATGLWKAAFNVPSTGSVGSYGVVVAAHKEGSGDASALTTFEVKPTWLQAHAPVILGATSVIGTIGALSVVVAWKQGALTRRKDELPFA